MIAWLALIVALLALGLHVVVVIWVLRGKNHFNDWVTNLSNRLDFVEAELSQFSMATAARISKLSDKQNQASDEVPATTLEDTMIRDPRAPWMYVSLGDILDGIERRYERKQLIRQRFVENIPESIEARRAALHVCIPLWNRASHLKLLLTQLQRHADYGQTFIVHVADFGSDDCDVLGQLKSSSLPFTLKVLEPPFAKSPAMDVLFSDDTIPASAVILCCDVDMAFPFDVYRRIHASVIEGTSFYCPLVSYASSEGKFYGTQDDHGGHGFLAAYKSDILKAGGYAHGIYRYKATWGGEETDFAWRLEDLGLHKVRRKEFDIAARYHERPKDNDWYRTCLTKDFHEEANMAEHSGLSFADLDKQWQIAVQRAERPELRVVLHAGLGNKLYQIAAGIAAAEAGDATLILSRNDVDADRFAENKTSLVGRWQDFLDFGGHPTPESDWPATLAELFPKLPYEDDAREPKWIRDQGEYFLDEYRLKKDGYYDESFLVPPIYENTVLEGYFFSRHHYFHQFEKVREYLTPNKQIIDWIDEKYSDIIQSAPIGLHLRFGYEKDHYNPFVPSLDFYQKILDSLDPGLVWVFTDRPELALSVQKQLGSRHQFKLREQMPGEPDYLDMFLMSRCASIIMGISSFSAWAAALSPNPKIKVFFHHRFLRKHGRSAALPNWIEVADSGEPIQAEARRDS